MKGERARYGDLFYRTICVSDCVLGWLSVLKCSIEVILQYEPF